MRKILGVILGMMIILSAGCKAKEELADQPRLEVIEYTNLIDDSTKTQLETLMTGAGVSKEHQHILLEHISQMNGTVNTGGLISGFQTAYISKTTYNPEIMEIEWQSRYPDFPGYNSRITVFGVFQEFLDISADGQVEGENLAEDINALQADHSVLSGRDNLAKYKVLYSAIETEGQTDTAAYVELVQKTWEERGVKFLENENIRMISFFVPKEGRLSIEHTGLLFPIEEDKKEVLYFLEKTNFKEPYRLIRFTNRTQLSDYLLIKYDQIEGGEQPFILENNQVMEGYRLLPQKTEK